MAKKPKVTRTPKTKGNDREAIFNTKTNTAMKLMDKAFENGKPRAGTSVTSRIANKASAWRLLEQGTKALSESRRIKKSGERMARVQAAAKSKQK